MLAPMTGSTQGNRYRFQGHETLRPFQDTMIEEALTALKLGGSLLAAAPTGIGKTAAALAAALEVGKQFGEQKTIMFLTGRQSQHRIIVETVRDINRRIPDGESSVTLVDMINSQRMCILPISEENPSLFNKLCSEARGKRTCKPFIEDNDNISATIQKHPLHVHELVELAKGNYNGGFPAPVCAWKAARENAAKVDIVVADYNHLFHDNIREASLTGMGLGLENLIVIVDEAHNLPDRIRGGLERRITPEMVRNANYEYEEHLETMALFEANGVLEAGDLGDMRWAFDVLQRLRKSINSWFRNLFVKAEKADKTKREVKQIEVEMSDLMNLLDEAFDAIASEALQTTLEKATMQTRGPEKGKRLQVFCSLLQSVKVEQDSDDTKELASHRFADLLDALLRYGSSSALALVFETSGTNGTLISHLLDPSLVAKPVFDKVAGSLLMSGTLYPPEMYAKMLGLGGDNTRTIALPSPFLDKRRPIAITSDATTLYNQRGPQMTAKIQSYVEAIVTAAPGHVAVFTPSYYMLNEIINSRQWPGTRVLLEERDWGKTKTDRLLQDLEEARGRGTRVLLGGVFGGKLAEGIDYHNNLLDAAICIGIPMAPPSVEGKALQTYLQDKFGSGKGFQWGAVQPAINSVLQAVGRPIRNFGDRAFILLLDSRHDRSPYKSCLPSGIQPIITQNPATALTVARRFFKKTPSENANLQK